MSVSTLSQIENSIQDLSLQEQLRLLEWLAQTIRSHTVFEQSAGETNAAATAAPNGISTLTNGNGTAANGVSEETRTHKDSVSALQKTVARIKARPPNPAMVIQPTMTIEEVAALWEASSPTDEDIPPDEWDRLWAEFEANLKAADRAKDIAEGRF